MARILLIWASADWSVIDVSSGYSNALRALGHEVKDFRLSQRIEFWSESLDHWGELTGTPKPDVQHVLREASGWALLEAASFKPDLVLITCAMGFHPNAIKDLTEHGYRTALILTESPYDDGQHAHIAPLANYVFTNEMTSVPVLREFNPRTFYLPTAFDHTRHRPDALVAYQSNPDNGPLTDLESDVLFVGTGFGERERMLAKVPWKRLGWNFQLHGFWGFAGGKMDPAADANVDLEIDPAARESLLPYVHPPITNDETAARYTRAKIILNFYRTGAAYSMNPRAYEIAACGGFQLAQDSSEEAHEIFGDTIAYFSDETDLVTQVEHWLNPARDTQRRIMAGLSRSRIVHTHSYANRANQLLYTISQFESRLASTLAASELPVSLPGGQSLAWGSPTVLPSR